MTSPKPEDRIYLTYKTRMTTEARLRKTAFLSYVLLAWYSFVLIVFSLLDLSGKFEIPNFSMISAIGSIATFSLSLFIYGERYSERADQFRTCYLKLQELYSSSLSSKVKLRKYAEILDQYQNQTDKDYDEMLFDAWWRRQGLRNAEGPIAIAKSQICMVLLKRTARLGWLCLLFLIPVIAGVFWVRFSGS
jgi:hypothetical protein